MGPEFPIDVKRRTRELAASICSNPSCLRLCSGPGNEFSVEARYIGEVAHISDAKPTTQRWEPHRDDTYRSDISNALFLCPNCHTLIDKNNGAGYPITLLKNWKIAHQRMILDALTGEYRLAHALKSQSAKAAQVTVLIDLCASMRALSDHTAIEVPVGVSSSFLDLKVLARSLKRQFPSDTITRKNLDLIVRAAGKVQTSLQPYASTGGGHIGLGEEEAAVLLLARQQIGSALDALTKHFGMQLPANLVTLVPAIPCNYF